MAKNVVVCCDGTANQFAQDRTNVVKLFYTLEQDQNSQVVFYHPGLGTMEPAGALTTPARTLTRGLGMAIGYGLASDIRDAYTFIMNNYRDEDQLYLFGFSRGAYTARAVCSMLAMYGLIYPGNDPLVPYVIRMMMAIEKEQRNNTASESDAISQYFRLADDFKGTMSRKGCNPHFVGVWDTVSSVGWKDNPVKLPFTADNPSINIGRHAIALDERRAFFRTNRWIQSPKSREHGPKDAQEVWFAGVHCDIGGGYAESESGLAKLALEWMLAEAKRAGLHVNAERQAEVLGRSHGSKYAPPDANGRLHESLQGWWKLAERIRKPHFDRATGLTTLQANRGKRRTIPAGAYVHESVFLREDGAYAARVGLPPDARRIATIPEP